MDEILGIIAKKNINSLSKTLIHTYINIYIIYIYYIYIYNTYIYIYIYIYISDISINNLEVMLPNVKKVMSILLTSSATTSVSEERANCALRFIKTDCRNTMSEDHFNSIVLLYVNWDIKLHYNRVIQLHTNKYLCRLLLINPLLESWKLFIHKERTLWFVYSVMLIILSLHMLNITYYYLWYEILI